MMACSEVQRLWTILKSLEIYRRLTHLLQEASLLRLFHNCIQNLIYKISKYFNLQFLHLGIQSGSGVHLPSVGNRQQPQAKPDQVSTSTQPLAGANNLELGELEQLTITNDNESSYDVSYLYSSGVIRIKKHNVFALFLYKTQSNVL